MKTYPFVNLPSLEERVQDVLGNMVNFQSCDNVNALFHVTAYTTDGNQVLDVDLLPGQKVKIEQTFDKVHFENKSGGTATGKFTLGVGQFLDDRVNGEVQTQVSGLFNPLAPVVTDGTKQTIPANAARTYITAYAPATNAGPVWIGETNKGIPLPAGGNVTLPTTAAITLQGAAGLTVNLVEV